MTQEYFPQRGRLYLLQGWGLLLFAVLLWRVGNLQLRHHAFYEERAQAQYRFRLELPAERGTICDRNGVVLAAQVPGYFSLLVRPGKVTPGLKKRISRRLGKVLSQDAEVYYRKLQSKRPLRYLAREVSMRQKEKLAAYFATLDSSRKAFWFDEDSRRSYPFGDLTGRLLGMVNRERKGVSGLELSLDSLLRGEPGERIYQRDCKGDRLATPAENGLVAPIPGARVELTIDSRFQVILQEELAAVREKYAALSAMGVIMDAVTGEILALGARPGFDPNVGIHSGEEGLLLNPIVSSIYEPGSTFKTFTFAQLLTQNRLEMQDSVDCHHGRYRIGKWTIGDAHHGFGTLTAAEVFYHSSNIGTALLSQRLSHAELFQILRRFGIGGYTFVDLPGEVRGILPDPEKWPEITHANIAFGHGVSVTPLQLVAAYAVFGNGGRLMRPHVIRKITYADGRVEEVEPLVRRSGLLSPRVLAEMNQLLRGVVTRGTGQPADVPGLNIRGKTGTAQKPETDDRGRRTYSRKDYFASFAGLADVDGRTLVGLVLVDTPRGTIWGGTVAGGAFGKIMTRINRLPHEGGDQLVDTPLLPEKNFRLPDFRGMTENRLRRALKKARVKVYQARGSGVVTAQDPPPGYYSEIPEVTLTLGVPETGMMPDLRGVDVRTALEEVSRLGLLVSLRGQGRVVRQEPGAGVRVNAGEKCRVELQ